MTQDPERLAAIVEVSRGAVNRLTAGIICLYLTQFMSYGRAKWFVRAAILDNVMNPTCREYKRFQRLYTCLPSSPAIIWKGRWKGFGLFFGEESHELYSFQELHWKVRIAIVDGALKPNWTSYFEWRKQDPRCHSRPRLMKGFTTTKAFFWQLEQPKPYCFGALRLLVRYAVKFQGLEPNWRSYAKWCLGNPRANANPRLMNGYTDQSDFFGVVCGTPTRRRRRTHPYVK
jgi:hypothetical protein